MKSKEVWLVVGLIVVAIIGSYGGYWMTYHVPRPVTMQSRESLLDMAKVSIRGTPGVIVGKMMRNEAGTYYGYLIIKTETAQIPIITNSEMVYSQAKIGSKAFLGKNTDGLFFLSGYVEE